MKLRIEGFLACSQVIAMRSLCVQSVVLFVCIVGVLVAPGYSYRLSDALKLKNGIVDRKVPRFSTQHGSHLHPSRARAEKFQTSLWQQTKSMAAEEGRLRSKVRHRCFWKRHLTRYRPTYFQYTTMWVISLGHPFWVFHLVGPEQCTSKLLI